MKTIASDELQLAKLELTKSVKTAAGEAAVVVLGGIVALIGFGMLCVVAVVALAPVISALWLRLLIMAVIYLVAGGAIAGVFAKKLAGDVKPDMSDTVYQAKKTVENVKEGLKA
ncbi:MAG: phage holin family protein [Deltaproteobacteria bacterium]|nr:phage holin family protein [Deltaproteobacteria bacterium]